MTQPTLPDSHRKPIEQRYNQLETQRNVYLNRARECSVVTIPTLYPPQGFTGSSRLPTPYQSLGARGVNSLSAKLLLALLPPNSPFFRLTVDDFALAELAGSPEARAIVEKGLNQIERAVMAEVETGMIRPTAAECIKHLIVSGNALLHIPIDGGIRLYKLDSYVIKRDPMGNILEIITKESMSPMELPEAIQAVHNQQAKTSSNDADDSVDVFTRIKKTESNWEVDQEVCGIAVPEASGTYPLEQLPWIALRFIKVDGEDYGRGYCEEYLGDLKSLEGLSKALLQASAVAAKVVFLVAPNSTAKVTELATAESGDFRQGRKEDIHTLQVDKQADMAVCRSVMNDLKDTLAYSFMMNTAIQRQGERVTAEEIRYMAQELESGLGGIYSTLSQEFQLPLVTLLMARMQKQKRLPKLPEGAVKPAITTGVEAIGRGNDLTKLKELVAVLSQLGPEAMKLLDIRDLATRTATALGMDSNGILKSEETIQAEQQQASMAEMMKAGTGPMINQMGSLAGQLAPYGEAAQAAPPV